MMRRYLSVDDQPETGGVIEPYSGAPISFSGRSPVKIGARCYCNACEMTGVIAKAGGPRRHIHVNTELALDGDILLCACPRPPRMIAGSIATAWFEDMGTRQGKCGDAVMVSAMGLPPLFDERVTVVGAGVSVGYPYFIQMADGRTTGGHLDEAGALPRIFTECAADYHVYWGDEALAMRGGK